jgi:hypothetical protein
MIVYFAPLFHGTSATSKNFRSFLKDDMGLLAKESHHSKHFGFLTWATVAECVLSCMMIGLIEPQGYRRNEFSGHQRFPR